MVSQWYWQGKWYGTGNGVALVLVGELAWHRKYCRSDSGRGYSIAMALGLGMVFYQLYYSFVHYK